MATVISLISSSPGPEPAPAPEPEAYRATETEPRPAANRQLDNAGIDDFDLDDFVLPEWPPPARSAKKRKLSPTPGSKPSQIKPTCDIDLLSEPDLPSALVPVAAEAASANGNPGIPVDVEGELDDISFTSSAPKPHKRQWTLKHQSRPVFELSSESLPDDVFQLLQNDQRALRPESTRKHQGVRSIPEPAFAVHKRTSNANPPIDIISSSPPSPQRNVKSKESGRKLTLPNKKDRTSHTATTTTAAAAPTKKANKTPAERLAEKAIKQREKDAKAKERRLAAQKAEVNKSKINKNDTITDMIVEMCASLSDTAVGSLVRESMDELKVDTRFVGNATDHPPSSSSTEQCHCPRKTVRWKRKVNSEYDHEHDEWVPLQAQLCQSEKHILIYITALEFVAILAGCPACSGNEGTSASPDETTLQSHVDIFMARFRSAHGDCIPILLIQGLDAWLRKKTNTRNREYMAAVRSSASVTAAANENNDVTNNENDNTSTAPAKRRKRKAPANAGPVPEAYLELINAELVSNILLHLQLSHAPLVIQHTKSPELAAVEITKFTQHLSTRPGRLAFQSFNLKSASFCMETGQVRTGDNPCDVYARMLQAVQRVTPSMAYGIVSQYATIGDLVKGFKSGDAAAAAATNGENGGGKLMLQDVHKSMNRDGAWSDRKLGPMVSKRLYKIFMGRDPATRDGVA